jgi:hypothetical protein
VARGKARALRARPVVSLQAEEQVPQVVSILSERLQAIEDRFSVSRELGQQIQTVVSAVVTSVVQTTDSAGCSGSGSTGGSASTVRSTRQ